MNYLINVELNYQQGTDKFFESREKKLKEEASTHSLTNMATFQTSSCATVPSTPIDSKHEDMIHDSQFDYYGKIYF